MTGTYAHGQTVTIRGNNFGAGKAPLLWDDFEAAADGERIRTQPQVGTWAPTTSPAAVYSTTSRHSGSKSLYGYRPGGGSSYSNFDHHFGDFKRNVYISYWFRYNAPQNEGQIKMMQMWGTYQVGDHNPGFFSVASPGTWWFSYTTLESPDKLVTARVTYPTAVPAANQWHHFEGILKQSDAGVPNGQIVLKVNGETVYNRVNVVTRELADHRWKFAAVFTGMTNMGSNATATWVDDAYISDTWARVVIGNATTLDGSTIKDVQPATSWTADGIVVKFNQGAFQPGQTAYVYVVNADGTVNANGYPITIGNSSN